MKLQYKKYLDIVDGVINKIPAHIRDIIQKASLALFAIIMIAGVLMGIQWGVNDAKPLGIQFAETNRELFYFQQLREENASKLRLVEDISPDESSFEPGEVTAPYQKMGEDTMGRLRSEENLSMPDFKIGGLKREPPMYQENNRNEKTQQAPEESILQMRTPLQAQKEPATDDSIKEKPEMNENLSGQPEIQEPVRQSGPQDDAESESTAPVNPPKKTELPFLE